MPHITCPHCASPVPAGIADCPNCHSPRSGAVKHVHAAALGMALLGLSGCDFLGGVQSDYGVSETATESDTEATDTESGDDTNG